MVLKWGHYYHPQCILQWKEHNNSYAVCRDEIIQFIPEDQLTINKKIIDDLILETKCDRKNEFSLFKKTTNNNKEFDLDETIITDCIRIDHIEYAFNNTQRF
jgi:hypothetical protein